MQVGHILYSGILPWLVYDGRAGAMLAPVIFAILTILAAVLLLAIFIATQASMAMLLLITLRHHPSGRDVC